MCVDVLCSYIYDSTRKQWVLEQGNGPSNGDEGTDQSAATTTTGSSSSGGSSSSRSVMSLAEVEG